MYPMHSSWLLMWPHPQWLLSLHFPYILEWSCALTSVLLSAFWQPQLSFEVYGILFFSVEQVVSNKDRITCLERVVCAGRGSEERCSLFIHLFLKLILNSFLCFPVSSWSRSNWGAESTWTFCAHEVVSSGSVNTTMLSIHSLMICCLATDCFLVLRTIFTLIFLLDLTLIQGPWTPSYGQACRKGLHTPHGETPSFGQAQ